MKAQVEVQFNWVMVLIAGALIFLFFFGIIRWITQSSSDNQDITAVQYFESIITSSSVTKSTLSSYRLPSDTLTFTCDAYAIGNARKNTRILLFAPSFITGNEFITWTQTWDIPFRVGNFLYLSSPEIRTVFVGSPSDTLYTEIRAAYPLQAEYISDDTLLQNANHDKFRIIYVNQNVPSSPLYLQGFKGMDGKAVTALSLSGSSLDSAQLHFYQKTNPAVSQARFVTAGQSSSHGKASTFGAFFVDDAETYDCVMEKALERMKGIAEIYAQRTQSLSFSSEPRCSFLYQSSLFSNYISASSSQLSTLSLALQQTNINAQRSSCALLY